MRFGALSLLRYGHFTDRELQLPRGEYDLHVIYGPNEAGKSTCQSAVGDLLFGIPRQMGLDFLHAGKDLRLGAALEGTGETRRVFRRKGNKDTLLDEAGNPIAEAVLAPFLSGADRSFFERMFSLNRRRLEEGGQEILAAEGRLGQTLFAAGAGLAGLHQALQRLDDEADKLWAPRASKKRTYYAAEDRLKEARQCLREAAVAVKSWKDLSRKVQEVRKAQEIAREALDEANRRKARAERIRRVLPHLMALRQHEQELAGLGEIPSIPEDALQRLREAEQAQIRAQTRLGDLGRQLDEAAVSIAGVVLDEPVLRLAETIDALAAECGLIEDARRKLPGKEAELAGAQRRIQHLAHELGWERAAKAGAVLARLPARVRREDLHTWIDAHDKCRRDRDEAQARQVELEREIAGIDAELRELGATGGDEDLTMALRDARRLGNIDERLTEMGARRERLGEALAEGIARLSGWCGLADDLAIIPLPQRAEVEQYRAALDAVDGQIEAAARQQESDEERLESLRLDRAQIVRDGQAIPREALAATRGQRDGYWDDIRSRWLDHASPQAASDKVLAEHFGAALTRADELADRRFDNAEAAAALARIDLDIERAQAMIARAERRREAAVAERNRLGAQWLASWRSTGVTPAAPRVMLDWLEQRDRLLEQRSARNDLDGQIATLREQLCAHRDRLLAALQVLGGVSESTKTASFEAVVDQASRFLDQIKDKNGRRAHLGDQHRKAAERLADVTRRAKDSAAAYERWREGFAAALTACELDHHLTVAAARTALQTLQEFAGCAEAVERLQEEIAQLSEQMIGAFEQRVGRVFQDLGAVSADEDPVRAVRILHQRLTSQREARLWRRGEEQRIERLQKDQQGAREALAEADAQIAHLCGIAGAKDLGGLNEAIQRAAQARSLRESIQRMTSTALQAGDGKSLEELQAEATGVDADQLAEEVSGLAQTIAERTQELGDLSADLRTAESELKKLDGAEDAAMAENQRQQALTDMSEAVHGYVWKRSAAMLLRWSLDRYRREKQGPLLSRAGELFRALTLGGFDHLEVDFDEQDRLELTGLRSTSAERVRVRGMSVGTADQLYFALRMAAIEEYLGKAPGLPFVADDLFINFDDARAVAGLEILAALSCRTQVLFFTHHAHLVGLAERSLRGRARVVEL